MTYTAPSITDSSTIVQNDVAKSEASKAFESIAKTLKSFDQQIQKLIPEERYFVNSSTVSDFKGRIQTLKSFGFSEVEKLLASARRGFEGEFKEKIKGIEVNLEQLKELCSEYSATYSKRLQEMGKELSVHQKAQPLVSSIIAQQTALEKVPLKQLIDELSFHVTAVNGRPVETTEAKRPDEFDVEDFYNF